MVYSLRQMCIPILEEQFKKLHGGNLCNIIISGASINDDMLLDDDDASPLQS